MQAEAAAALRDVDIVSTNAGTSRTSVANSSTTISSAGGARSGPRARARARMRAPASAQERLAPAQLGEQRDARPLGEVRVEVGDQPGGVRQLRRSR